MRDYQIILLINKLYEDPTFKILLLLKKFFDTNDLELPAVVYKDPYTIAICNNKILC